MINAVPDIVANVIFCPAQKQKIFLLALFSHKPVIRQGKKVVAFLSIQSDNFFRRQTAVRIGGMGMEIPFIPFFPELICYHRFFCSPFLFASIRAPTPGASSCDSRLNTFHALIVV